MLELIIFVALIAVVLEAISLRGALRNVTYTCKPSQSVVDPNEEFAIITVLENNKFMPVSYLEVMQQLPCEIKLNAYLGRFLSEPQISRLYSSCYIMSRQKLTRTILAALPERGRYFMQGATLGGGDLLGLRKITKEISFFREIVVLPARLDAPKVDNALGGFLGDVSVSRFILEDPVLIAGVSEYTGREPMKTIDWKHSASLGRLMVKKFDYTVENSVTVILDVESKERNSYSARETCFSLARSVIEQLETRGVKYAFMTNATTAGAIGQWSAVSEGLGGAHASTILEGLGRATHIVREPFLQMIARACQKSERGRAHIIVSTDKRAATDAEFDKLRMVSDGRVFVVCAEDAQIESKGEIA